jgi:hypothetical protein
VKYGSVAITVIGALIAGVTGLFGLNPTFQAIGIACGVVVMTIGHCTFLVLQRIDGLIPALAEKLVAAMNQSTSTEK